MLKQTDSTERKTDTVTIKKYANRRLYNTESSTYVTLDDLAEMVRADRDFNVFDAKTQEDLTHGVLTQIIVDQESRGQNMLPVPFLRQLIRFYDESISRLVPGYLQYSLETFAREQETFQSKISQSFSSPTTALDVYQDQVRRNMEIFQSAMSLWSPFGANSTGSPGSPDAAREIEGGTQEQAAKAAIPTGQQTASKSELAALKLQLEAMQRKVDELTKSDNDSQSKS